MAHISLSIDHSLGTREALRRIKTLLSKLKRDHGGDIEKINEHWDGTSGHFDAIIRGFAFSGNITVLDASVELQGELPFALGMFKKRIARMIEGKAVELLS